MYKMNDEGLKKLAMFVNKRIAEEIGIHERSVSLIKREGKLVNKQTAYCLTKFINPMAEIEDFFDKEDK